MTKISVLGCGWLGFPLAQHLLKKGYTVLGSTTSESKLPQLKKAGIIPFQVSFPDTTKELKKLLNVDILVINIPPGTKKDPTAVEFLETMNTIIKSIGSSTLKHVIYTSSTSVYGSDNQVMKEVDSNNESPLEKVENRLVYNTNIPVTILRLGGLLGPERTLLRFFSGKERPGGNIPVNYVYLDDVIGAITTVIEKPQPGTYNICADEHPTKEAFYTTHCERKGMELPVFTEDVKAWKIIDNSYFKETFNFKYSYPDPLSFPL